MAQLANKYGHFSDDGKEYIITDPNTPMPWVNVLANEMYGMVLSQAGSGYSWREHASLNRITRWDQDLIRDEWGKYVYLRDADSGEYWSPTWQPCGDKVDRYQVRHGMGYTVFESQWGEITCELTCFVPLEDSCEIWLLRVQNKGSKPRNLQVFTYLEWLLGAAPDWHREFHRTFIDTQYDAEHGALLAGKVLWELPVAAKAHWNRDWPYTAFHSASEKPAGHDGDKRDFIGRHGSVHRPQAVIEGRSKNNASRWGDQIASLQIAVTVGAGDSHEIAFNLGAGASKEEALELIAKYRELAAVHLALDEVKQYWQGITTELKIDSPDAELNMMANGWLQYQAISARIKGRTAYYQTGGAYGFRDQLQDSLLWLVLGQPERTLRQIKFHAEHQYQDGVVLHWWHPLADTGMRSDYSDDLLWLPFVLIRYLHETDDIACLDEVVRFYDKGEATLRDHCQRSFEVALSRLSERGLPFILKGDWNDGLNAVGADGRGESVWMAHFLHHLLGLWADVPTIDPTIVERFRHEADALREAVNKHAWDGEWYWRATMDDGPLVGSKESPEGKIFLNAQTWSVLGNTADADRAQKAMDSARKHLYQEYGPLLLAPAYSIPDENIGYLSRYAPGIRENGGVYVHAACWAVLAERQQNGVDAAYDLWRRFCPIVRSNLDPDAYSGEPYVMPGNVSGPLAPVPGQAGWTWYTGSGQWFLRVLMEGVLGIQAWQDGLRIKPELPTDWDHLRVERKFRNATYEITFKRDASISEPRIVMDGAEVRSESLPIAAAGTTAKVEISVPIAK
jgi:cellobiose phosphorylase